MVGPGFGAVDAQVVANVVANVVAAEAIRGDGHHVEEARIPVLERDVARDAFDRLHVTAMRPACREATSGREAEMSRMAKTTLSLPGTSTKDYVAAEQAAERLRGLPPGVRRSPDPGPARPGAQARHRKDGQLVALAGGGVPPARDRGAGGREPGPRTAPEPLTGVTGAGICPVSERSSYGGWL